VKSCSAARGVQVNEKALVSLFQDSPLLSTQHQYFVEKFFFYAAKTIFGVMPESIDTITINDIFQSICERFPKLTVNDLQLAFRSHQQTEKVFVLTREIFIQPIAEFNRKKNIVTSEIAKEIEKGNEVKSRIRLEMEFREEARKVYLESLKVGKWLGTCFQAAAIGRNFSDVISNEDRAKWVTLAKETQKKNRLENEKNPMYLDLPWEKIYAQLAMEDLIKRNQKFIQI
jgi:hypothetical protein